MPQDTSSLSVNGRDYGWPNEPVVVICVDGCAPAYLDQAIDAGAMPWLAGARAQGTDRVAECVIPSFTNPNNVSIVTGAPPAVHGICGNYFYDREADAEVMMNDPRFVRAETILAAFSRAGASVAVVTAKDKLRRILGEGIVLGSRGACFSAEHADTATVGDCGIDGVLELVGLALPDVYSAALSEFVFAAGVRLMETRRPDITYLSTTDYVQHKHAPGTTEANAFYTMMDGYLGRLAALGARIAFTADHGMAAKTDAAGNPRIIFLQELLDQWLGAGAARVILPITDPYVVHHGALGAFATAYLPTGGGHADTIARIEGIAGIEAVMDREAACARFQLPADRTGDIVVLSEADHVIGTTAERHDLSALDVPLRSHGGLASQRVPFFVNRKTADHPSSGPLRNFDIFDAVLNRLLPT
jgi:phosphonoacetate hydrolase